jgi:hypothetical protein
MVYMGGGFIPENEAAQDLCEQCVKGEVVSFTEVTARDLKFHKCYMKMLSFIYGYMPKVFRDNVPKQHFYRWLKHLQGHYKIVFEFKDGTKLVEYESIAFGNMSEKRFREYIKEQIPYIYENVLGKYFEGEMYDGIINTIEEEFEKFLSKL